MGALINMNREPMTLEDFMKRMQDRTFREASKMDLTVAGLSGKLFFSQREWNILRDRGRDRTFGILPDGRIVEYTEMINFDMLQENPEDTCGFDDAKYLGIGSFHHFMDVRKTEW